MTVCNIYHVCLIGLVSLLQGLVHILISWLGEKNAGKIKKIFHIASEIGFGCGFRIALVGAIRNDFS